MTEKRNNVYFQLLLLVLIPLLAGCGEPTAEPIVDRANNKYGGLLRANILVRSTRTLFPPYGNTTNTGLITTVGYETLVKFDLNENVVVPSILENWDISEDGKTYTFHIRPNVYFHEDPCLDDYDRVVTSEDVAYCLSFLSSKSIYNRNQQMLQGSIAGSDKIKLNAKSDIVDFASGIEIIDDNTLTVTLNEFNSSFLNMLTHHSASIYPREMLSYYGKDVHNHMVGTGPFALKALVPEKAVIFKRNMKYWQVDENGYRLPYLDGVKLTYEFDNKELIHSIAENKVDMLINTNYNVLDKIQKFADNYKTIQNSSWSVHFIYISHNDEKLNSLKLRQAFNYAIDRNAIIDTVLNSVVEKVEYGILPSNQLEDNFHGYEFAPNKARKLLAEEGYGVDKPIPSFTLHIPNSELAVEVAHAVSVMIKKNLGISLELSGLDNRAHYNNHMRGTYQLAYLTWNADYFSPDGYLKLYKGDATPENGGYNVSGYKSSTFDNSYMAALRENDSGKRKDLFLKTNYQLHLDAAIIPLFVGTEFSFIHKDLENVPKSNGMLLDFTKVYKSAHESTSL